jgi:hypothetical protein
MYRAMLRLYPYDYEVRFAAEMLSDFEERLGDHRHRSKPTFVFFLATEFLGVIIGAGVEWMAKLTTDSTVRGRCLPDVRMMRPPGISKAAWFSAAGTGGSAASWSDDGNKA